LPVPDVVESSAKYRYIGTTDRINRETVGMAESERTDE